MTDRLVRVSAVDIRVVVQVERSPVRTKVSQAEFMTASLVRHLGDCGADLVKDVFQASPVLSCEGAGIGLSGFNLGSEAAVQFALVNQFALVLIRASRQTGLRRSGSASTRRLGQSVCRFRDIALDGCHEAVDVDRSRRSALGER